MKNSLSGHTIAITEHRLERELRQLLERDGAHVVSCPLLEECLVEELPQIEAFVRELIDPGFDLVIFFTGVGFQFLHQQSKIMGLDTELITALKRTRIVARGPKPQAALRKLGLQADLTPTDPTSEGLLDLLASADLKRKRLGVQLYGTPNEPFCSELASRGAQVRTVQIYNYRAVSDTKDVLTLIDRLIASEVDAIMFTSAPQVASLFEHAGRAGRREALISALRGPIVVAAIGRVTARSLELAGVPPDVIPGMSKMRPMVAALASYFRTRA